MLYQTPAVVERVPNKDVYRHMHGWVASTYMNWHRIKLHSEQSYMGLCPQSPRPCSEGLTHSTVVVKWVTQDPLAAHLRRPTSPTLPADSNYCYCATHAASLPFSTQLSAQSVEWRLGMRPPHACSALVILPTQCLTSPYISSQYSIYNTQGVCVVITASCMCLPLTTGMLV